MSRIFEGLQQTETQRFGHPSLETRSITELLMEVERAQQASSVEELEQPVVQTSLGTEPPQVAEPGREEIAQFRSVPLSLSPNSRLVCTSRFDGVTAEKFRILAVLMRHLQQARRLRKVLITSTLPEEGKSFVAVNLALTLARGKSDKVIFVEADLRRPIIAKQFGLNGLSGLREWLQADVPLAGAIYHLEAAGIWVLPAGNVPRHPLELMQAGSLPQLFDNLSNLFDWIIIDSPPIVGLADASVLAKIADGVLLVTREGKTEKKSLLKGLEILDSSQLLGVVLNGASNTGHTYYYDRFSLPAPESSDGVNKSTEVEELQAAS
jgi:capsular exopolysaccharide synthesis family protein